MQSNGTAAAFNSIPKTLLQLTRWIHWDVAETANGKPTKRPTGSTLDPTNRLRFGEAMRIEERREAKRADGDFPDGGLGLELTGGVRMEIATGDWATLMSFDMDGCRCPRTTALVPWAEAMVDGFGRSFTEVTPSGAGLRLWLFVRNPPKGIPKIRVPHPAPPGVSKKPEIQTFGCGPAGFVAMTAERLPGTGDIEVVDDLDRWMESWKVGEVDVATCATLLDELLPSEGDGPTVEAIAARVDADLVAGEWKKIGVPSASECWWRLVREVLHVTHHHGPSAVEFLLTETAFSNGLVDSRDPDRYMRRDWVVKDVARIAEKAAERSAADVFETHPLDDDWEPPETKPRIDGDVLQAADFVAQAGEVEWVVWNVIPAAGKLGQIFGDPSCGKTPFAVHLALSVALGLPTWFGHDIDRRGGAVGIMVGEDGAGIGARIEAQLSQLDPLADLADVPLFLTTRPARLIDPKNAKAWADRIRAAAGGPLALLIVDTQNRNFGPGNENATEDMTLFVDSIDALARALGCCVLLVHHTGHMNKGRSRGASVLPAALDVAFEIKRTGRAVTAHCTKAKLSAEPEDMLGHLVVVRTGTDRKGRATTAITLSDTPPDPADLFNDENPETMDQELIALLDAIATRAGQPQTQLELSGATGLSRKQLRTRVQRAKELGLIEVVEGSGRTPATYNLTDAGDGALLAGPEDEGQQVSDLLS